MGLCASQMELENSLEEEMDLKVTDQLFKMNEVARNTIRLLLLGAGECGKSTILKQMKILHMGGFDKDERKRQILIIRDNSVTAMKQLIVGCQELQYSLEEKYEKLTKRVMLIENTNNPSKVDIDAIETLWKHSDAIKRASSHSSEIVLLDSHKYFLDRIPTIYKDDYTPSNQDILQSRCATIGIMETKFIIEKVPFVMYDVGGQRGERKKWIHCFDGVRAIMYVASLSEYDQVLAEDENKNRMQESLTLFEGILSLIWFHTTPIILFLNKDDIFKQKIKTSELGRFFNDYHGGFDYKEGLEYIKGRFMDCNVGFPARPVYVHITTATNTENIEFVWNASKNIILCANLQATGLII